MRQRRKKVEEDAEGELRNKEEGIEIYVIN